MCTLVTVHMIKIKYTLYVYAYINFTLKSYCSAQQCDAL